MDTTKHETLRYVRLIDDIKSGLQTAPARAAPVEVEIPPEHAIFN
ncbi:hypothetical protein PI124_g19771 [Phytophthora idaei]|nr:hypothetical protein PI125_g20862 [Phytophthora idaei]KAG3138683.1 hypothetical protein PI126_g16805 [Phytophthora idaei]KAG3235190.1 hypothetical protein PI124_g19771 [Phytophthora idaei]